MADPTPSPGAAGPQPKAALNYRLGGDHCHVCMYYTPGQGDPEKGTCSRVLPPDVDGNDLCDDFKRAGHASSESAAGPAAAGGMPPEARALARRGMISDKAMSRAGGGY